MKDATNKIVNGWFVWKMAIVKSTLVAFIAGYTTLQTSLNGVEFWTMTSTQRFILICGVLASMATSYVAFLDKTISRIEAKLNDDTFVDSQPQPPTPGAKP